MAQIRKKAYVRWEECVSCGCCEKVCPTGAIRVFKGMYASVDEASCVGCMLCQKACPASVIEVREVRS